VNFRLGSPFAAAGAVKITPSDKTRAFAQTNIAESFIADIGDGNLPTANQTQLMKTSQARLDSFCICYCQMFFFNNAECFYPIVLTCSYCWMEKLKFCIIEN